MSVVIRPMIESDLSPARRIVRHAFGTFLGAPDLDTFWTDFDYVYGRHAAEHTASFVAEADDAVVGSNFATRWGSVGFFGPLSVSPERQGQGFAKPLVDAVSRQFEAWGTSHNGLFTFPHSPLHVGLYGQFGFYPRFLTAIMSAPSRAGEAAGWSRHSQLAPDERQAAETACRGLCDELYPGLDLGGEIRTVASRQLGDTLLMWEGASRLAGFAVCHWGAASEAGAGFCFVKFGAVRPGPGAKARFAALLDAGRALAAQAGMANLLAGVNLAREEAYRQMQAAGFRTWMQGVAMHRPNEPGYSRPGLWVLDDWR